MVSLVHVPILQNLWGRIIVNRIGGEPNEANR